MGFWSHGEFFLLGSCQTSTFTYLRSMILRVILLSTTPPLVLWLIFTTSQIPQKPPASPSSSQDAETQEIMMRHDRKCSCGGSIRLQTETNLDEHFSHAGNCTLVVLTKLISLLENFVCSLLNLFHLFFILFITQVATWTTEGVHWLRTSWWEKSKTSTMNGMSKLAQFRPKGSEYQEKPHSFQHVPVSVKVSVPTTITSNCR